MTDRAAEIVGRARSLVAITGAGVSAESGIPTFRGIEGMWKKRRPEELATPEAFAADPSMVWEFYRWRRRLVLTCEPNPAHRALARLEELGRCEVTVITQNVDGLHRRAGSKWVVELHGDLFGVRCSGCEASRRDESADFPPGEDGAVEVPRCAACGEPERPGVVWFGERLDERDLEEAWGATKRADVVIVAGTSAVVQPAASIYRVARARGTPVIEVNLERTPISDDVDVTVLGKAGEVLPGLLGVELEGS